MAYGAESLLYVCVVFNPSDRRNNKNQLLSLREFVSEVGSQIELVIAKIINTTPPIKVTVLTDIFCAMIRPPITPKPVQMACPIIPPDITPHKFSLADSTIVVICERSPHSATNVIVKACIKIRNSIMNALTLAFLFPPASASPWTTLDVSRLSYNEKKKIT